MKILHASELPETSDVLRAMAPATKAELAEKKKGKQLDSSHFTGSLLEKYVEDPFLFQGKKTDVRVWALVTSFDPPRVYIARKGYFRTSGKPYTADRASLEDKMVHATNNGPKIKAGIFRVNEGRLNPRQTLPPKESPEFRSIGSLDKYYTLLEESGMKAEEVEKKIADAITKAVVAAQPVLSCRAANPLEEPHSCAGRTFSVLMSDLLITRAGVPVLMEVHAHYGDCFKGFSDDKEGLAKLKIDAESGLDPVATFHALAAQKAVMVRPMPFRRPSRIV